MRPACRGDRLGLWRLWRVTAASRQRLKFHRPPIGRRPAGARSLLYGATASCWRRSNNWATAAEHGFRRELVFEIVDNFPMEQDRRQSGLGITCHAAVAGDGGGRNDLARIIGEPGRHGAIQPRNRPRRSFTLTVLRRFRHYDLLYIPICERRALPGGWGHPASAHDVP